MADLVATAAADLAAGRWQQARDGYAAALDLAADQPDAEALDGFGAALWWLGEPAESLHWRQRAYAEFRRAGRFDRAVLSAVAVAVTYESNFANHAAAAGWAARAQRLAGQTEPAPGPLTGWTWVTGAYLEPDPELAAELCRRVLDIARAAGDPDLELCGLSGHGRALVALGRVEAGMALIGEAMAGVLAGEYRLLETVVYTSCDMMVACDLAADVVRAAQWCQAADRFIDRYGCPFLYARCRTLYGGILLTVGRWAEAEAELDRAVRMSAGAGPAMRADALARLAELRLRQGRLEQAEALLADLDARLAGARPAAALRMLRGDAIGAVAILDGRLGAARGTAEQAGLLTLLVEAQLARGDPAAAEAALARLAALPTAPDGGLVSACVASGSAQLAAARSDGHGAAEMLARAVELFAGLGYGYESATALLRSARLLAGTRPDAAAGEATTAMAVFRRLGAARDADAAAAVLRSLGKPARQARPAPDAGAAASLTAREREVLALLAAGLSNREIAGRLFISRKTAGHHVSNILAKLALRNRAEAGVYAATRAAE